MSTSVHAASTPPIIDPTTSPIATSGGGDGGGMVGGAAGGGGALGGGGGGGDGWCVGAYPHRGSPTATTFAPKLMDATSGFIVARKWNASAAASRSSETPPPSANSALYVALCSYHCDWTEFAWAGRPRRRA